MKSLAARETPERWEPFHIISCAVCVCVCVSAVLAEEESEDEEDEDPPESEMSSQYGASNS